ncbi:guanine nucleotide-binding protein subunit alpha Ecym_7187 [Eremothecium cymbalariae DBVPG|uniref:Guanine nucleotide-binding protein alpha-2 subunit n=1 Tax=Eremothecium cymbalariae (strain CBS 270.75 / DBVPG 7215 / KCTC 17166 / NRRL Y-17582) TaxID=931890 RepID=G8JW20_ERECY|nr:hypothetical protein Ecym_7187 [Eremothecium cymbalariae DBVPG\
MGLCASKNDRTNGRQGVGTKYNGRCQGKADHETVVDEEKRRVVRVERGTTSDVEMDMKQEASPSQSTSATAGDRKRSVVSATSRQSTVLTTSGSQPSQAGMPGAGGGNRALKVLLLGSGESGKSTVLKQLKILHQNGFSQEELLDYKPFIFDNIVDTGRDLINARAQFKVPLEEGCGLTQENLDRILNYSRPAGPIGSFPRDLAVILSKLWELPSTKQLLNGEHSSAFYLMDNAGYFFGNLEKISQPDYHPTVVDILRTRKKTSGIFDTTIEMDSNLKLHIYDVGGQRSERKKWIHCFDNVTMIIFCVSLSEYYQTLMEDKSQNRLEESLILFDSVVNSRWFTRTSVVLFLNKIDAFAEKLQRVPLERYFPDYTGGPDINKAAKYILWRFVQLNRANLNIYPHVTQATDTSNIRLVFAAIKETILENSLKDSGVL